MSFNLKNFVLPFTLALIFTVTWKYFSNKPENVTNDSSLKTGQSRVAPKIQEVHRPLDFEVDFWDTEKPLENKLTTVETDFARYDFSTHGAAIETAEFKHFVNNKHLFLKTINANLKEDRCLLVAFAEKTPFYYNLVDLKDNNEDFIITYESNFSAGSILKKFTVYKHINKIDLEVSLNPTTKLEEAERLRIIFPAPFLADVKDDIIQGVFNENEKIVKKEVKAITGRYWEIPSFFGLENHYYVNAMIGDLNNFIQRAYYKQSDKVLAMLEGPAIQDKMSWKLSFYFGPKQANIMMPVDTRLENTLDYGYFSILAKPLLEFLNLFYRYVGSYGLAIILLTIFLKLLLLPFTLKGEQSMKKNMEFQRKLQYLQTKHKDDKEALAAARAELIQKQGIPGMGGCLPILLQIPVFFSLSRVLANSIELYQAPFLWIPDLSAADPYYILSILIALSMVLHTTTVSDVRKGFSSYAMALVFGVFTARLSSGLALFIFVSSALTVVQTKLYSWFKKA